MHTACMARAEKLLAEDELTVKEAAEACGYDDPFYFSRVFRRYFGTTPGKVRKGMAMLSSKP